MFSRILICNCSSAHTMASKSHSALLGPSKSKPEISTTTLPPGWSCFIVTLLMISKPSPYGVCASAAVLQGLVYVKFDVDAGLAAWALDDGFDGSYDRALAYRRSIQRRFQWRVHMTRSAVRFLRFVSDDIHDL